MGVRSVRVMAGLMAVFCLCCFGARAFLPPGFDSFQSRNQRFDLRRSSPIGAATERWVLVDRHSGDVKYRLGASLSSKWVYVSDDGRCLCAVDLWRSRTLTQPVLTFYRDGHVVRTYQLGDLIRDTHYIYWNVWVAELLPGWPSPFPEVADAAGRFALTTLDLSVHTFDLGTCDRVGATCSPLVPRGAVAYSGGIRLMPPAIERTAPRRFAFIRPCAMCDSPLPREGIVFDVPETVPLPVEHAWFRDEYALPNAEHWATVVIYAGHAIEVLPQTVGTDCE